MDNDFILDGDIAQKAQTASGKSVEEFNFGTIFNVSVNTVNQ